MSKKLKIAQIAPIIERVPPKKYGGTERMVHALTEQLVKRGYDVTLYASGDSITSAKLKSVHPRALREVRMTDLYGSNYLTMLNIGIAYKDQDKFDVIHDHNGHVSAPTANISATPVVMTIHGQFTTYSRKVFETLDRPFYVTISKAQAAFAPYLHHAGTVHNGLDMKDYPFSSTHDGYLLFVGRISMEKGVHNAIEVAQFLDLPLIIAAKLESVDMPYFQEYIGPRLSDQIRWIGEVDEEERNKLYSKAICLLHPVTWHEPFGLTLIEAMACGAPVIAFNKGSIPEIIKNGKTGYVVDNIQDMISAIININHIKREDCRKHALENFNVEKMADGYLRIYENTLKRKRIGKKIAKFISAYSHKI